MATGSIGAYDLNKRTLPIEMLTKVKKSLLNKKTASRILFFLIILIGLPILLYTATSSVTIPEIEPYKSLEWLKYNEPGWVLKQTVATEVFLVVVVGTLLFWRFRLAIGLTGLAILLATGLISLSLFIEYANLPLILFLASMMIIIHYLDELGLFEEIMNRTANLTQFEPRLLLVAIMALSAIMAALVDEVSSILFMSTLIMRICKRFKLDAFPYMLTAIVATNIGSTATVVGNPVGVYVALRGGLTAGDFFKWSTPAAILSLLLAVFFFIRMEKGYLSEARAKILSKLSEEKSAEFRISKHKHLRKAIVIFIVTLGVIFSHNIVEKALGLDKNVILIAGPIMVSGIVLLTEAKRAREIFERGVDWWTLLFFICLFGKAATLEHTGVTQKVGIALMTTVSMLEVTPTIITTTVTFVLLTLTVAMTSAGADNLAIVAAMFPVASYLANSDLPYSAILWWPLVIGGCYGGNLTTVGSTANIVALDRMEKARLGHVDLRQWLKRTLVITILTLIIASLYIIGVAVITA